MKHNFGRDIIHRWEGNPIITLNDLSFRCSDIHNAGIVKIDDKVIMLLTIETPQGYTQIYRAKSFDGINFTVDSQPLMSPAATGDRRQYENFGPRDARITQMDDKFYITFVAESSLGFRIGIATTHDFKSVDFIGYASQVDVKNGMLFPKKINGRYAMLKRPTGGSIWISYSDDLIFWGDDKPVMTPRGGYWDASRIGPAAVPIETENGWLLIYYGTKDTSAGPLVRLGAAMLNMDDPSKVKARTCVPIISPRESYERIGDIPNMIFSCGAIMQDGELWIYYGASDSCICLGTVTLSELKDFCGEKSMFVEGISFIEEGDK